MPGKEHNDLADAFIYSFNSMAKTEATQTVSKVPFNNLPLGKIFELKFEYDKDGYKKGYELELKQILKKDPTFGMIRKYHYIAENEIIQVFVPHKPSVITYL